MSMIIHKKYLPDIDIDTSSFVYEGNYILIQDEYICDVLKCMNVPEIADGNFYDICDIGCFIDYPEILERYALKSPNNAYHYAMLVIRGRFELGEKAIASNSYYSYYYARKVIKGRFELGESVLATDAMYSYGYAHDVLKGRFELGEHVILNSKFTNAYIDKFLC